MKSNIGISTIGNPNLEYERSNFENRKLEFIYRYPEQNSIHKGDNYITSAPWMLAVIASVSHWVCGGANHEAVAPLSPFKLLALLAAVLPFDPAAIVALRVSAHCLFASLHLN